MKKKGLGKTCVYCGQPADSEDHIPSLNLFVPAMRRKAKFTKVYSCRKCNGGFSMDEEFFRNFIVTLAEEHSDEATRLFNSKVRRSIEKRPALGKILLRNMSLVDVITDAGIFVGKRTKIEAPESDRSRIFNVMDKYVKGLISTKFGSRLPGHYIIRHVWTDESLPILNNNEFRETIAWNKGNFDTFIFGFARIPDSFQSIWVFIFFKKIFFLSFVIPGDSPMSKIVTKNIVRVKPNPLGT